MPPTVSILIPAYNAEPWIADTLRSALAQTWTRREIIVVDDGSSDRTLAIARSFASEQVCVVSQPNAGAAAARNRAAALCQGDYVQWLDADDLLAPEKIRRQVEMAEQTGSQRTLLSCGWGSFSYRISKTTFAPHALWQDLAVVEWLFNKLEQNLFMMNSSWLVSRELTEAAGPWDARLSLDDDGEYFSRVLLASDGVRFTPKPGCYYRRSSFSTLSNVDGSDRKLQSLLLSLRLHTEYLRSLENSARTRAACLRYLQRWLLYFYPERPDLVRQLQVIAAESGGQLEPPTLRSKYAWLGNIVGWQRAKRIQILGPELKHSVCRKAEQMLYHWERLRPATSTAAPAATLLK
jgi:glycosyltransferase involved in cell wall biosynthesis